MYRRKHVTKKQSKFNNRLSKDFTHAGLPEWTGTVEADPPTNLMFLSQQQTSRTAIQPTFNQSSSIVNDEEYLGFINGRIVGIQYYRGMVSNHEMVSLEREPWNAYDRNAVCVNNVRGEKVGHIKREMAKALAPIMDKNLARVEGLVPNGSGNMYSIPVILSFWGDFQAKMIVSNELQKFGYALQTSIRGSGAPGRSRNVYGAPKSQSSIISSSQVKEELQNLFENLKEVDQTSEIPQSDAVKTQLFKHQRQAVCWMIRRENGNELPPFWKQRTAKETEAIDQRSGTVKTCVELSTGKTLVVISLVVGNSADSRPLFELDRARDSPVIVVDADSEERQAVDTKSKTAEKTKLQRETDDDCVIDEKFSVTCDANIEMKEKGATRGKPRPRRNVKRPAKYDNELVGFDLSEPVPAKERKPRRKAKRANDDQDYLPDIAHERTKASSPTSDFDDAVTGSETLSFIKGSSQPTLIVCPLSVISNWEHQVKEHLRRSAPLSMVVYHGTSKTQFETEFLNRQDVVITTYQTLANEYKKSGCLYATKWLRVVLDEGHVIRNPNSLQAKACYALKSPRKWVLSGTPIQNSIKDLYSLVSFLGLEPFTERSWWRRIVERPLKNGEKAALKRVQCLLGAICMRRTKDQKVDGKPIVDLPTKEVVLCKLEMSPSERVLYNQISAATRKTISNLIEDGSVMKRYAEVLVILMRLRQLCCHPCLAQEAIDSPDTGPGSQAPENETKALVAKLVMLLNSGSVEECCVCLEPLSIPVITRCAHIFCKPCISEVINSLSNATCPLCRRDIDHSQLIDVPPEADGEGEVLGDAALKSSTKVDALMSELIKLRSKHPDVKSLVVSQFTSFLKVIEKHLQKENINCVLFHGGMSGPARNDALRKFESGNVQVLLLSLKSGGVGLNLTTASRVFLMEPAWNPAAEEQCFDRVHRLGQAKPVRVIKFICANSVEEKITEIQEVKRDLASKSMQTLSSDERRERRVNDLKILMSI